MGRPPPTAPLVLDGLGPSIPFALGRNWPAERSVGLSPKRPPPGHRPRRAGPRCSDRQLQRAVAGRGLKRALVPQPGECLADPSKRGGRTTIGCAHIARSDLALQPSCRPSMHPMVRPSGRNHWSDSQNNWTNEEGCSVVFTYLSFLAVSDVPPSKRQSYAHNRALNVQR